MSTQASIQSRVPAPVTRTRIPEDTKKFVTAVIIDGPVPDGPQVLKDGLDATIIRDGTIMMEPVYAVGVLIGRKVVVRHPENGSVAKLVFSQYGPFIFYVYSKPNGVVYIESGASNSETRPSNAVR